MPGLACRALTTVMTGPRSILVVDDDAAICWSLRAALEAHSFRVQTAASARAAQRIIAVDPISLVITDVRMPDMSGLALVAWMREQDVRVPVVVATAYDPPSGLRAIAGPSYWGVLPKPIDLQRLLGLARRATTVTRHEEVSPRIAVVAQSPRVYQTTTEMAPVTCSAPLAPPVPASPGSRRLAPVDAPRPASRRHRRQRGSRGEVELILMACALLIGAIVIMALAL